MLDHVAQMTKAGRPHTVEIKWVFQAKERTLIPAFAQMVIFKKPRHHRKTYCQGEE